MMGFDYWEEITFQCERKYEFLIDKIVMIKENREDKEFACKKD